MRYNNEGVYWMRCKLPRGTHAYKGRGAVWYRIGGQCYLINQGGLQGSQCHIGENNPVEIIVFCLCHVPYEVEELRGKRN